MSTAVHHLNCATMAPALSFGGRVTPVRMVAHCLLVEGPRGLTLVDTGFGTGDLAAPRQRMGRPFVKAMRPALDPAETAVSQVRGLGLDPAEVTDIVLTHLDLDHAGGLGDFPRATVHVFADELESAMARRTLAEKGRYVPAQWAHGPRWLAHEVVGERWHGFDSVAVLDDDVALVPLRGHTRGHCAVAVRRPGGGQERAQEGAHDATRGERWFLHAGDAYFHHDELLTPPQCPPGLRSFQAMVQLDRRARHANQDRLRALYAEQDPAVEIFCAHDAAEYDALAGTTD